MLKKDFLNGKNIFTGELLDKANKFLGFLVIKRALKNNVVLNIMLVLTRGVIDNVFSKKTVIKIVVISPGFYS